MTILLTLCRVCWAFIIAGYLIVLGYIEPIMWNDKGRYAPQFKIMYAASVVMCAFQLICLAV